MSMFQKRCVFPELNISVFSPNPEFPWHEERYGSKDLPWKKWKAYTGVKQKEKKEKKDKKKTSYKLVVKKIIVGGKIRAGIEGALKGKLLMRADLPIDLEVEVAKQMEACLPSKRRNSSLREFTKSVIFSDTIFEEDDEEGDSDVFADEYCDDIDLEELEYAMDHFLDKLENLDAEDLHEITSGIQSALKSWLAFGASISGGGHKPKSIASVRKSQSGSVSSHVSNQLTTPQSRMQVMFRDSEEEKLEQIVFDEDMGPQTFVEPSFKSQRAATALANLNKGEHKLNRKSGEKMQKITGDFCVWLRELPEGDDQTVNNTSPDKIRALFDTHRNEKVATSKVAEGLRSWAKFGQDIAGSTKDILTISTSEVTKVRAFRKFMNHAKRKKEQRIKGKKKIAPKEKETEEIKLDLDHRNYGAWYIHPSKWGERFDNISDPKSIEFIKTRKMTEIEKQKRLAAKEEAAAKEDPGPIEADESNLQLPSVMEFAKFLQRRKTYEPPGFLKRALKI